MATKQKGNNAVKALTERAILAKFVNREFQPRKRDDAVADDVAKRKRAENKRVGNYWKKLFPRAAVAARCAVVNEARRYHRRMTLPWLDDGTGILPVAQLKEYTTRMREYAAAAKKEEEEFLRDYEKHIGVAKQMLGDLFNPKDYPTVQQARRAFAFEVTLLPVPAIGDWRVEGINANELAALKKDAVATFTSVETEALRDLWERLHEVVDHLHEKLNVSDGVFRDSTVKNVGEMVELLGKLNIMGNPQIEAMRKEVAAKLTKFQPDVLREDKAVRTRVAKDAGDILKKMAVYMKAPGG